MSLPPTADFDVCPPGEDVLARVALRAEAEADKEGWGGEREARNHWWWIHDNGNVAGAGRTLSSLALAEADLDAEVTQLHPVDLVAVLERSVTRVPRTLMGFVLVSEAWMLAYKPDDEASRRRVFSVADRREVWRQPDRVEVRTVHLQMLTGKTRAVLRMRGQKPILANDLPPNRDVVVEVPAAMARLATTLRLRKYGRRG